MHILRWVKTEICAGGSPALLFLLIIVFLCTALPILVNWHKSKVDSFFGSLEQYCSDARLYWADPHVIYCANIQYLEVTIFNKFHELKETHFMCFIRISYKLISKWLSLHRLEGEFEQALLNITDKVTGGQFYDAAAMPDYALQAEITKTQRWLEQHRKKCFWL